MKILIIGGSRFVGLQLAKKLSLDTRNEVHVLSRSGTGGAPGLSINHKGDRRRPGALAGETSFDTVIDFAGFSGDDIKTTLETLTDIKHYIFISCVDVYDPGRQKKESDFNPNSPDQLSNRLDSADSFRIGKRHAEATVMAKLKGQCLIVRWPALFGTDDYTGRLQNLVGRAVRGEWVVAAQPNSRFSTLTSTEASEFLEHAIQHQLTGVLNVAHNEELSLTQMFKMIEEESGSAIRVKSAGDASDHSPYQTTGDLTLATDALKQTAFKIKEDKNHNWLRALIQESLPATGEPSAARGRKTSSIKLQ